MARSRRARVREALDELGGRATSREISRRTGLTPREVGQLCRFLPGIARTNSVEDANGDAYAVWGWHLLEG